MNKFSKWLLDNDIGSESPAMCIALLNKARKILIAAEKEKDVEIKLKAVDYVAALHNVAETNGEHAKAVIEKLGQLLDSSKKKGDGK